MLKIATFNLRIPVESDGVNYFPNRAPGIVRWVRENAPHAIGFQELTALSLDILQKALPEYAFVGTARDAAFQGERCCIAYRHEQLALDALDTVWLSPTPYVPGSRFPVQGPHPRVMTWARLRFKEDGRRFYLVNTHLDHKQEEARMLGLEQVLKTAREFFARDVLPIFVTGDFNFTPAEAPYALIEQYGFTDLTATLQGTAHGFGRHSSNKIDYILSAQSYDRAQAVNTHICREGVYLSDHDPVLATLSEL